MNVVTVVDAVVPSEREAELEVPGGRLVLRGDVPTRAEGSG